MSRGCEARGDYTCAQPHAAVRRARRDAMLACMPAWWVQVGPVPGAPEGVALLVRRDTFEVVGAPHPIDFVGQPPSAAGLPPALSGGCAPCRPPSFITGTAGVRNHF